MGLFTFLFPFPSPPSCSRELVLVNVEDHNMITPSLMKLNHFSSKRKGWGDRLAGRPARDERILKAGWQARLGVPGGGRGAGPRFAHGGGGRGSVARRSRASQLGPRHLPQVQGMAVGAGEDVCVGGCCREQNLQVSHLGRN